jgi:hypothetical protein
MSSAIWLSISCICVHAHNYIVKGRASAAYERAMSDLESMSDPVRHTLLWNLLIEYVTLLTNSEGPAPSAPALTRREILERDTARKEARAAAAAAAAAPAPANPGGGGDSGGCSGCGGDDDNDGGALGPGEEEDAASLSAAAKAAKSKGPAGKKKK